MPPADVLMKLVLISELPPAVYINQLVLFMGQAYFSSGRLFRMMFMKFLDSCAYSIYILLGSFNITLSQNVPKFTRHFSISASWVDSMF